MISPLLNDVVAGQAPEPVLFTTQQYHRLTETGVLLEGSPVELIEGVIVWKDRRDKEGTIMNHGPTHGFVVSELFENLRNQLDVDAYHVRNQLPITLTDNTEPEPDLAVVLGKRADYAKRHPGPNDIRAVIEVSYSSRNYDCTTKQRIYASANIPFYWIVNLPDRKVEAYERPDATAGEYLSKSEVDESGDVQLSLPDGTSVVVSIADILPPAAP